MPHELYIQDGKVSMMYVDEEPWHGLGTRLERPATAEEAIRAANLDWEVAKLPLYAGGAGAVQPVPDRFAVVRGDLWGHRDCPVLGIVGPDYTPLQNREAFAFFDPIVGKDKAIYHTAGSLGNGERVWILAKLPDDIQIIGDDIANKYLLLSNSHDGNSSVQIKFTPIRVVCQNTLTLALSQGPTLRVAHTRDLHQRLQNAERLLGLIRGRFDDLQEAFRGMTRVQMGQGRVDNYLELVFPNPRADALSSENRERALALVAENRAWARHFYEHGKGNQLPGVVGTLWAAYNGVTEYVDHRSAKYPGGTNLGSDRRLDAVWFGTGYLTKARAYKVAEEKLKKGLN